MIVSRLRRRNFVVGSLSLALVSCRSNGDGTSPDSGTIGPLIAASDLAARLDEVKRGRIAVLYVGPDILFDRGHIPGARKVGEAGDDEGRRALSAALAIISADTEVVLYCGCCPVRSCPNVRPASAALRALGRTNARLLDLPTRFATDWADKGYPVERG
jgi:thiosulfate/3-mercaptopyruvate sulfurtransferase